MELTKEQLALIQEIKQQWVDRIAQPIDHAKACDAITAIYQQLNLDKPRFYFCDSPFSAVYLIYKHKLSNRLVSNPNSQTEDLATIANEALLYEVGQSWAELYEAAKALGTVFDEEKYNLFVNYCKETQTIFPYKEVCYVCERPIEIHWDGNVLHNDNGPAVLYKDGWKIFAKKGLVQYTKGQDKTLKDELEANLTVETGLPLLGLDAPLKYSFDRQLGVLKAANPGVPSELRYAVETALKRAA